MFEYFRATICLSYNLEVMLILKFLVLIYMTSLINIVLIYFVSWIYNHNVQCNLRISFENVFPKTAKCGDSCVHTDEESNKCMY